MSEQYINPGELPCPVCGAEPEQRIWANFTSEAYHRLLSPKHQMIGSQVTPLICTVCGYVQLFTNPKDFRE